VLKLRWLVGHVVVRVPQAELDVRKSFTLFAALPGVLDDDTVDSAVEPMGRRSVVSDPDAAPLPGDQRVAEAVPALVEVELLLDGA